MDGDIGAAVGGIGAIVGHNYSASLRLKGGKGLACAAVLGFYFAPAIVGFWVLVFLATVLLTRLMVEGQMVAMALVPIIAYFAFPEAAITSFFATALVLIRHAPRIKNVLDGTEPKMYYKIREPG
jgi:glycerol-3-phosphate acyltransferase PlsY